MSCVYLLCLYTYGMKLSRLFALAKNALLVVALAVSPLSQAGVLNGGKQAMTTQHHETVSCHSDTLHLSGNDEDGKAPAPQPDTPSGCAYHCLSVGLAFSHGPLMLSMPPASTNFKGPVLPKITMALDVDLRPPIADF